MRLPTLLAFFALAGPSSAAAQEPTTSGETARAFFAALDGGSFSDAAGYLSPDYVAEQRASSLAMALTVAGAGAKAGRDGMVISDSANAEVLRAHGNVRLRNFPGAATVAEAAALPPREFLARELEVEMRLMHGGMGKLAHRIVGEVVENDSVSHVLYRTTGPAIVRHDPFGVLVLELRRSGGRWWVVPDPMLLDPSYAMSDVDPAPTKE